MASRQRSRETRAFPSGIRFPSGQPEWQNGMPQSMQRAPCSRSPSTASGSWYSAKSFTRSSIGRLRGFTRSSFRKPPSSPIEREHLLLGLGLDLGALRGVAAILLGLLAGALGCPRGVLLLARLARLVGLLVAAVADRVRLALTGADRRGAVPLLGDHGVVARVDVPALGLLAQRALVVHRHDLHELGLRCLPLVEHAPAHRRARAKDVLLDQRAYLVEVARQRLLQLDELGVAALVEGAVPIEHVRDTAAHARREVASGGAEHHHAPAGHVLAAVVAHALHHGVHARVAHAEALARETAEERAPARGSV